MRPTFLFISSCMMGFMSQCYAELVAMLSKDELVVSCIPGSDPFLDKPLCRWDLKFKNESSLDSWLSMRVWPVHLILSIIVSFEMLLSSYFDAYPHNGMDENFNIEIIEEDFDGEIEPESDMESEGEEEDSEYEVISDTE